MVSRNLTGFPEVHDYAPNWSADGTGIADGTGLSGS